jgi:hypothetical protein
MGEHHQPGGGGELLLQALQHLGIGVAGGAAQIRHRQGGQQQPLAAGQFPAGGHHPGMFTVADQQFVAGLPGQTPQRQHTAAGHIFGEGDAVGADAKPASQVLTQPACGLRDEGPHRAGKGPQLLDGAPAGGDCLQRGAGQGPLAAVVEVTLVGQGGQLGP